MAKLELLFISNYYRFQHFHSFNSTHLPANKCFRTSKSLAPPHFEEQTLISEAGRH